MAHLYQLKLYDKEFVNFKEKADATNEFASTTDAAQLLSETMDIMSRGIKPDEERTVVVELTIVGEGA